MRVLYIVSDVNWGPLFEFTAKELRSKHSIIIDFIFLGKNKPITANRLEEAGFKTSFVFCKNKKDWIKTLYKLVSYIKKDKVEIIHCHCLEANLLGLAAGWLCGIKERIYTRHHAVIHHKRHKKSLVWDYLSNFLSTNIVSVSGNVSNILIRLEGVRKDKITKIENSIEVEKYGVTDIAKIKRMRDKYKIDEEMKVVGVCSRFDAYKGIKYIISGVSPLQNKHKIMVLFFGSSGPLYKEIESQAKFSLKENSYRFIEFERDLITAYSLMDIFIHVPIDYDEEAFGLVYIEAMASKVPCIFTKSGIASEIAKDKINSVIVPHRDSSSIENALNLLLTNRELSVRIAKQARQDVQKRFSTTTMVNKLAKFYLEKCNLSF